jgi:hypothetical protein
MTNRQNLILGVMLVSAMSCALARAGSIRATVKAGEPVKKVSAIQRELTSLGTMSKPFEGKLTDGKLSIENLPPGRYDLKFETASGSVEGWDASVPASDYEEEQPLTDEARKTILKKMATEMASAFDDEVVVLDLQGNIQNAAVLLKRLRRRAFVSAGYREGEWVWRADRWQWEDPEERNWVPNQETPWYALIRERLFPKDYEAKRITYARHLGGIALTEEKPDADLGEVLVPQPKLGINAINPDGSATTPLTIKPATVGAATQPTTGEAKADAKEGSQP